MKDDITTKEIIDMSRKILMVEIENVQSVRAMQLSDQMAIEKKNIQLEHIYS